MPRMASPDRNEADASIRSLFDQSYLTYLVPLATNFDPKEILKPGADSFQDRLAAVEQRDRLFFGTRFAHCPQVSISTCSWVDRR